MTEPRPQDPHQEVIRVTTGSLKLPAGVEGDASANARMNWVVIVVVAIALTFIGFIAWLIASGER